MIESQVTVQNGDSNMKRFLLQWRKDSLVGVYFDNPVDELSSLVLRNAWMVIYDSVKLSWETNLLIWAIFLVKKLLNDWHLVLFCTEGAIHRAVSFGPLLNFSMPLLDLNFKIFERHCLCLLGWFASYLHIWQVRIRSRNSHFFINPWAFRNIWDYWILNLVLNKV